jgi:RNA polymerase sigma-70 factor (ECF subfamily)
MGGRRGRRDRAFEQFCSNEYGRIVAAVALITGNRESAADAVNEAMARAWSRIRRGQTLDPLGAWVRVVALNIARDGHRHRRVEEKHASALVATIRNDTTHSNWGLSIDVRRALESLPRRQREVAVLRFVCDLSVEEIAAELGIAVGTTKSSLARARIALRGALQERPEEVSAR